MQLGRHLHGHPGIEETNRVANIVNDQFANRTLLDVFPNRLANRWVHFAIDVIAKNGEKIFASHYQNHVLRFVTEGLPSSQGTLY